jgi:hypothetical protein
MAPFQNVMAITKKCFVKPWISLRDFPMRAVTVRGIPAFSLVLPEHHIARSGDAIQTEPAWR